jgi:MFS family permease
MSTKNLSRWSGIACILAGLLIALATLVHPSRETPEIILEQELRLVAAHWLYTFFCGFLLLGLPGLYAAQSERAGRLGLVSFLMLFFGTLFLAVSGNYGFIAPVLAAQAPAMLDAINAYPPVVALNGLLIVGYLLGFIFFGIATLRSRVLPRQTGILMAIGSPLNIVGAVLSLLVFEVLWIVAILGALALGLGLAWAGYSLWSHKEELVLQPAG